MDGFFAILKAIIMSLSSEPILLVLALTILGIGYLLYKLGSSLGEIFDTHMKNQAKRTDEIIQKMENMTDDLKKLSESFQVHVAKTELRIDNLEKRIERLENKFP